MNIRDYWPLETPPQNDPEVWQHLIDLREATWQGFASIEATRGFVQPKVSLASSQGQEIIRIIAFRVIEELAEAHSSEDLDHYLEELIDAFNYLLSIFLLSGRYSPHLPRYLHELANETEIDNMGGQITLEELGQAALILGVKLGDMLRNRAWMTNSQNTYFDGDLFEILAPLFKLIFSYFSSFGSFWQYFVAKDAVLQFRLRSRY